MVSTQMREKRKVGTSLHSLSFIHNKQFLSLAYQPLNLGKEMWQLASNILNTFVCMCKDYICLQDPKTQGTEATEK